MEIIPLTVSISITMQIMEHLTKPRLALASKLNSTYFCDHCKIHGHSVERCVKLNVYPSGFKQRKFAGCVQENDNKTYLKNHWSDCYSTLQSHDFAKLTQRDYC